ncbi:Nemf [Symbiodinium microadriaticum]|nr:Nemf [Symbiodinium microadriaticum]
MHPEVNSIRPSAVGCKLANIYDINSKVYLLKLRRKGFRCLLLLESGVRFHLTEYQRDKSSIPSNYTMKLRKHLRNKRLTNVSQLGADRAVDFQFGRGETSFHLILEIYVTGNLILTDSEYQILALLRVHSDQETKVAMRQTYPVDKAMGLLKVPLADFSDEIEDILDLASARAENQEVRELEMDDEKAAKDKKKGVESAFAKKSKKRVQHSAMPVVMLLHKLAPFADPALCASCVAKVSAANGKPVQNAFKITVDDMSFEELVELEQSSAEMLLDTLRSVSRPDDLGGGSMPVLAVAEAADDDVNDAEDEEDEADLPPAPQDEAQAQPGPETGIKRGAPPEADAPVVPGWILRKKVHTPPAEATWANEEFSPLEPPQPEEADAVLSFPSFHRCVDEFFTQLEENKAVEQKAQHAQSVMARVDRIRADQGRRLQELEAEQEASERKASLIERNVELVDRALQMINAMLASQVDWGELWREVKRQQRLGHPIAEHIHSMNLEQNEFKILLADIDEEQGEDEGTDDKPMEVVALNLNLSAHANVARLHSKRKETRDKTSRTQTHAEAAIKSAERKAHQDLQKFDLKQTIRRVRQTWWFEKYIWFVSSENYLVVAGHDAVQTEQLFLKHLGENDAFIQADVAGARTCFVRNPEGGEVPPATLREAGTLALCHSTAWDKQIVISAWWVPITQVTRGKAPDEDHHCVDDFYVTGRRQFMPPLHLEMGMTLLFQVSETCAQRHKGERKSRYLEAMANKPKAAEEEMEEVEADSDHELAASEEEEEAEQAGLEDDQENHQDNEDDKDKTEDEEDSREVAASRSQADDTEKSRGKMRISRAERRRQRKDSAEEDQVEPVEPEVSKKSADPKSKGPSTEQLPRGQKSKAKKMKEKYADQDEDERELRLALLGSRKIKRAGGDPAKESSILASGGTGGTEAGGEAVQASTGTTGEQNAAQPKKEANERKPPRRPPNRDEVLKVGCDAERADSPPQLDLLTGQPQPEDEVLYAMPMVAPYCALGGPYNLRVKLTTMPLGRACLRGFHFRYFHIYLIFMVVGAGCGWLLINALFNAMANKPVLTKEGKTFGQFSINQGVVGLVTGLLYFIWNFLYPECLSLRAQQITITLLLALNATFCMLLAMFWQSDAPEYTFFMFSDIVAQLMGNATIFLLFPLIATYYAGWLVAPVRAGTDLSSLFATMIAQAQNPHPGSGKLRFSVSTLFGVYSTFSVLGLLAWACILYFGTGLRYTMDQEDGSVELSDSESEDSSEEMCSTHESEGDGDARVCSVADKRRAFDGLYVPRKLLLPILFATLSQISQWGLALSLGQTGAMSVDPLACDGKVGKETYRWALTASQVMVPLGSVMSSVMPSPRPVFYVLAVAQLMAGTPSGQSLYVGCFALTAGLEGYLLTMAFRYIGDAVDIPGKRPGNQKKGQAVRHCLKIFAEQTERRAWKLLVQAIPENEATQLMCGSCKMSMPGLQKLQQQLRKEKRKENKEVDKQLGQAKAKVKQKAPKK